MQSQKNIIYLKISFMQKKTKTSSLLLGLKMFSPVRRKVQRKHSISRQNKGNCQICVKLVTAGVSRCLLSRALKCFCCRAKVPQCKHSNIEGRNGLEQANRYLFLLRSKNHQFNTFWVHCCFNDVF